MAKKPSDLELQILSVLWETPGINVRETLSRIPDGKKRAYTSVLSAMQVMEKKGLLTRTREGLVDYWSAAVSRDQIMKPIIQGLVSMVFSGNASVAMQHLISDKRISDRELDEMSRLIEAAKREREAK